MAFRFHPSESKRQSSRDGAGRGRQRIMVKKLVWLGPALPAVFTGLFALVTALTKEPWIGLAMIGVMLARLMPISPVP